MIVSLGLGLGLGLRRQEEQGIPLSIFSTHFLISPFSSPSTLKLVPSLEPPLSCMQHTFRRLFLLPHHTYQEPTSVVSIIQCHFWALLFCPHTLLLWGSYHSCISPLICPHLRRGFNNWMKDSFCLSTYSSHSYPLINLASKVLVAPLPGPPAMWVSLSSWNLSISWLGNATFLKCSAD